MKRIKQDLNTEDGLDVFDVDVSVLETYSHIKLTTELTLNVTQTYFFITLEENECIDFASMCKKYHIIENLVNHAFKCCRK